MTPVLADQQQIEYVTSKVSMVETMHDGLRLAMSSLRTDVQDGNAFFHVNKHCSCVMSHHNMPYDMQLKPTATSCLAVLTQGLHTVR